MKTFRSFGLVILSVILGLNVTSCNTDEPVIDGPATTKEYTISINMTGEILDVNYSPLTRSESNDLYGIQVYSAPADDEYAAYAPYAFGLFDNVNELSIQLLADKKYKFEATLLVDGKNILAYYGHYYRTPFDISDPYKVNTPLNTFALSNDCYFTCLSTGRTELNFGSYYYEHPTADRYYGEMIDYIPVEDGKVGIDMKRVVFGCKYIVEGMDGGSLKILMDGAPEVEIFSPSTETQDIIYSFSNARAAYLANDYSENIPVSFIWTKDGKEIPQGDFSFTFRRKQITTITMKINSDAIHQDVGVNLEEGGLETGDNMTVENGQVVNTPVTPIP